MPIELTKDFINKKCTISLIGEDHIEINGIILAIEGYWVKIKENDCIRIVNGVLIRDIKMITIKR